MDEIKPREYQHETVKYLLYRYMMGFRGSMICADPGLGKTLMALMTYQAMRSWGMVKRALVVAPLTVAYKTWPDEIDLFEDAGVIDSYDYVVAHGSYRKRREAYETPADIYITNVDGVPRLAEEGCPDFFDFLIVDESTEFKSWSSRRTKAFCRGYEYKKNNQVYIAHPILSKFKYRLALTGTPTPQTFEDMFSQFFILDSGQTLGTSKHFFQKHFYRKETAWIGGQVIRRRRKDPQKLFNAIAPAVVRLDQDDHLDLPPLIKSVRWVELPKEVRKRYNRMERKYFYELQQAQDSKDRKKILATTAGAKYQYCKGLANGGIYENEEVTRADGTKHKVRIGTHHLHYEKVNALDRLHEELGRKPLLVAYQFDHDLERLLERWPTASVINGSTKPKERSQIIDDWNDGKITMLFANPAALNYGANMQKLSHLVGALYFVWFGLTDNLLFYQQLIKRLHRQGVEHTVFMYHLLCANTVEEGVYENLLTKAESQTTLLNAMREYRLKRLASEDMAV